MRWVLLPGMDGTGRLFDPLVAALDEPSTVIAYDPDAVIRYADQRPELPDDELVLLGESYSGPVAIRLATDPRVRGLVLCASFARLPYPAAFRRLGRTLLSTPVPMRTPRLAVRAVLAGMDAPPELVDEVVRAIRRVSPDVLRQRVRDVLEVDVRQEFAALQVPTLYLQATRDRLVGPLAATELADLRPDLRICRLDAPHLLLQRQPQAAARELRAFSGSL